MASPVHSTPQVLSHLASTVRAPSSTSSTARFAQSLASRSSKSSMSLSRGFASASRQREEDSFDVSSIPSVPDGPNESGEIDIRSSDQDTETSVPEVYLPPPLDDNMDAPFDLSDALQSLSRANSPDPDDGQTPRKPSDYDYSMSLKSEPKVRPAVR